MDLTIIFSSRATDLVIWMDLTVQSLTSVLYCQFLISKNICYILNEEFLFGVWMDLFVRLLLCYRFNCSDGFNDNNDNNNNNDNNDNLLS